MISYTTKEFYSANYLMGRTAAIDTAVFPYYAMKATRSIKQYTGDNIDETAPFTDEVQMCCCELAEYLYKQDHLDHDADVISEKKGEWSTTYVSGQTAEDIKLSTIKGIIYNWLALTGLLYRGC